ncbi:hypothetical protein MesoLjLc_21370 [Mesorhizobium sp. L-8-10]|uniref:hypothetical protein n=1 Tax=unclassified Mesorhizobium TaxID=325217 RepID=UPI0019269D97|nr:MULTISPECIES: hypothetical protein [unclassified Mesorhizobium]BCH22394.1 hypothetical protein MesoLjLb_21790 [Mesorhizobium sp. L-8-3]BCH30207.1 hypothetical protein MesoLjLc_21370 [Mesorhizobium sp. L-8-10]
MIENADDRPGEGRNGENRSKLHHTHSLKGWVAVATALSATALALVEVLRFIREVW